ncbi:MAG: pentapeptide repeat-containing protein [Alphaproteobacteria bacterium]|nr:pentapeptide repeat-containing protein [Alphaproteobacteria bacterium]
MSDDFKKKDFEAFSSKKQKTVWSSVSRDVKPTADFTPSVPTASSQKSQAVSEPAQSFIEQIDKESEAIEFGGKSAERGNFSGENLENSNFSAANLEGVDFSGANLKYADFSGANLAHANLSGADLTGAVLTGAVLREANFTGAKLKSVKLHDADIQDAILLDIELDDISLEELQELIEYLAKYYPHKLNLSRINLTLLDLSKVDLSKVSLRGVDFTGVSFVGVNIFELDLSECIITPEQIAQALGRVPGPEELRRLLAPKLKEGQKFKGIDFEDFFFDNGKQFGVWDTTRDKGMSIDKMLGMGKKLFRHSAEKPPLKEQEVVERIQQNKENTQKDHNRELRELIEERKRSELEARKEKKREVVRETGETNRETHPERMNDNMMRRGGNER